MIKSWVTITKRIIFWGLFILAINCNGLIQDGDWVKIECKGHQVAPAEQVDWWRIRIKQGVAERGAIVRFEQFDYAMGHRGFLTAYQHLFNPEQPSPKGFSIFLIDGTNDPVGVNIPFTLAARGRYCSYDPATKTLLANKSPEKAHKLLITDHFSPASFNRKAYYTLKAGNELLCQDQDSLRLGGKLPTCFIDMKANPTQRVLFRLVATKQPGTLAIKAAAHGGEQQKETLTHHRISAEKAIFKTKKGKKGQKSGQKLLVTKKIKTWERELCFTGNHGGMSQQFILLPCGRDQFVLHHCASGWNGVLHEGVLVASDKDYTPLSIEKTPINKH